MMIYLPFNNYYKKYYFNFITLNFLKILMNYIIIELQFLIKKIMKYIILNIKLIPMVHLDNSEINMIIPLKNIQSKELIQQLFDQNIAIGTRVNDLENEVKSLKSDFKNMSHIIENLKQNVKKFEENK